MLIVTSIPRDAVKTKHTYRGFELSFDIRPIDAEIMKELRDKTTSFDFVLNTKSGKMERVEVQDDKAYDAAMYDHIIAGWSGLGMSKSEPLPCTLENKLKLVILPPGPKDKFRLDTWLIRAAGELGKRLHEELESEIKN